MFEDVNFLTRLRPFRNYENLESLEAVVNYLKEELELFSLDFSKQQWMAEGNQYTNLIHSYQPDNKKRLIMGAHYDVCGDQPGADDNGSAVAGLIETIRLLNENNLELDYGIDFVFYCLEEPPFFGTEEMGSYIHAKSVSKNKENIIGMICYEMIGYFSDERSSQGFPHPALKLLYPSTANFIMTVGVPEYKAFNQMIFKGMKKGSQIKVCHFAHSLGRSLAGMSDQRNYWKFGIPALMINDTSFERNPNYHKMSDDIDTLDFEKMSEVINSMMRCLKSIKC
jgi:Zn-dependent M28 family amino/carboxypeptidase